MGVAGRQDGERLARHGIRTGTELTRWLLEDHALAVLAGSEFGDSTHALRFRAATSLLYGDTPQLRWQALEAPEPLDLPHLATTLDRLDTLVARIASC